MHRCAVPQTNGKQNAFVFLVDVVAQSALPELLFAAVEVCEVGEIMPLDRRAAKVYVSSGTKRMLRRKRQDLH